MTRLRPLILIAALLAGVAGCSCGCDEHAQMADPRYENIEPHAMRYIAEGWRLNRIVKEAHARGEQVISVTYY